MCHAVLGLTSHYTVRTRELVVQTNETLAVGIEAVDRCIHAIERIVVASLLVFCLVIDHTAVYLHFSRREITLEILHVGSCVP